MRKKGKSKKMKRVKEKKNKLKSPEKGVGRKRARRDLCEKGMKRVTRNKKKGVVTAVGGAGIESVEGGVKVIKKTEAAVEETEADTKKKEADQGVIEGADVIGVKKRKLLTPKQTMDNHKCPAVVKKRIW